jgi:integrase
MPRAATGQVVEKRGARGITYALRFPAYGRRQYVTLGNSAEGWTRARAEDELLVIMAAVRRGKWRPPAPEPQVEIPRDLSFHEFASQWWNAKRPELKPATIPAYENDLIVHLLPFFARHRLSQVTVQEVDRYKSTKLAESRPALREGRLAYSTINRHLVRLGQILDVAVEYDLIARNPVKVGKRKLKITRQRPVHLDSAEHIAVLLDAATSLERVSAGGPKTPGRRALLAVLVFGGLRVTEACELLWRDVDLAAGRIACGTKTAASQREVDILPVLRDELLAWKTSASDVSGDALVFPSSRETVRDRANVRNKVVAPAVRRADELLLERDMQPLPRGVTPHKLRHTFASLLMALGKPATYVMEQLGHTDATFTLRVYAHVMRRGEEERERLRALVEGRRDWAPSGTNAADGVAAEGESERHPERENPAVAGVL